MGIDCLWNYANKNTILRLDDTHSDSLVNDQILSEIGNNLKESAHIPIKEQTNLTFF